MTPMRRLAHLAPSAELSKGLYEVRFVELPWFSCSFLFQRGKNLSVQVMSDDDMIPSNTTENRFYGSVSCFTAQDLFYIDTDNISQAIIILWPNALNCTSLLSRVVWYFKPRAQVLNAVSFIKQLSTCHLNVVVPVLESLSMSLVDSFTWQMPSCML